MVEKTQSKREQPVKEEEAEALATRIYCEHALIKMYEVCNAHDTLSPDSELFKNLKQNLQQKLENAGRDDKSFIKGMRAEKFLNLFDLLDKNGNLKPDEVLLGKMKELSEWIRDNTIKEMAAPFEKGPLAKSFERVLKQVGFSNLEAFKANKTRGNPNVLRKKLEEDFALQQETDPNNPLIQKLAPSIEEEIDKLPSRTFWVKEDVLENKIQRTFFDTVERANYLKFMGKLLTLGQDLSKYEPSSVSSNAQIFTEKSKYQSYYDEIRKTLEMPELTNQEIAQRAVEAYTTVANGCWNYKQKFNPGGTRSSYFKNNVAQWISKMKEGRNDFAKLAFMSPEEEKKYENMTDKERWKYEIEQQHVSIHHKIDLKYHNLFTSKEDKKLLSQIFNLELIIGGPLHAKKHEKDGEKKVKLGGKVYYKVEVSKTPDSALVCAYTDEKCTASKEVAFPCTEPEKLTSLRRRKSSESPEKQAISKNIFLKLRSHLSKMCGL